MPRKKRDREWKKVEGSFVKDIGIGEKSIIKVYSRVPGDVNGYFSKKKPKPEMRSETYMHIEENFRRLSDLGIPVVVARPLSDKITKKYFEGKPAVVQRFVEDLKREDLFKDGNIVRKTINQVVKMAKLAGKRGYLVDLHVWNLGKLKGKIVLRDLSESLLVNLHRDSTDINLNSFLHSIKESKLLTKEELEKIRDFIRKEHGIEV